ncbi:MAG TPA: hypothetical protein VG890_11735 [Puia sp.]|nr:hypothetical protein [Puia sp.]
MIRYNPSSQLSLEGFTTPFAQQLSASNRWVVLAQKIPWDKLAAVYYPEDAGGFWSADAGCADDDRGGSH